MIRMGDPLRFDPTKVFFSLPLGQARDISARVANVVVAQASGGRELLDGKGNDVLRDALAHEFPRLSANDLLSVAGHVGGSAHMLAAVEWRNAGHRPGDTPEVGLTTLEGGLLIQLHATPESLPPNSVPPNGRTMRRCTSTDSCSHRTPPKMRCDDRPNCISNTKIPSTSIGRSCKPIRDNSATCTR